MTKKSCLIVRDKRSQWRYIYLSIVTCTLFAFILFPSSWLDVCNRSKNLGDMLGIYIREWKITCVTVVALTHDQATCRHSHFCSIFTHGDTDETSLVKMTKNSFPYSLNDEGIGLVIYPTPFRVVVTKVEERWSLAKTCQRGTLPEWPRLETVLGR